MDLATVKCPRCNRVVMVHPDESKVVECPYCNGEMVVGRSEVRFFAIDAEALYWKAMARLPDVPENCCFIIEAKNTADACKVICAAVNCDDWVLESIVKVEAVEAAHHLSDDCAHAIPLNYGPLFE